MDPLIKKLLSEGRWMSESSITFGDGSVILLEEVECEDSSIEIQIKNTTNIHAIIHEGYDNFSFIDVFKIIETGNFNIYVGEGSLGGDGFMYLFDKRKDELLWFAFFDFSNPFINAEFQGNKIIAESNDQKMWTLLLDQPEIIIVEEKNI